MVFYLWDDKPKRTLTAKEKEIFRDALYPKQQGMCAACKEKVSKKNMHLDHIKAHAAGGSDRITNLQLLCGHCNSSKGTKTQAQFKKALATKQAKSTTKTASAKKATSKATATKKPAAKKRQTKQRDPFADLLGI